MGDDVTVTLQTDLDEAIEHLQPRSAETPMNGSRDRVSTATKVPLLEPFRNDPDLR